MTTIVVATPIEYGVSGFGVMPLGGSPMGVGEAGVGPVPRGALLRNPLTGGSTGSRAINPITRDYVLDANGRALGMDDIQQLVFIAVATVKNGSAMRGLGQSLSSIAVVDDAIESTITNILTEALAHLTGPKFIAILSITVTRGQPGAVYTRLQWRDLTSGLPHTMEI